MSQRPRPRNWTKMYDIVINCRQETENRESKSVLPSSAFQFHPLVLSTRCFALADWLILLKEVFYLQ